MSASPDKVLRVIPRRLRNSRVRAPSHRRNCRSPELEEGRGREVDLDAVDERITGNGACTIIQPSVSAEKCEIGARQSICKGINYSVLRDKGEGVGQVIVCIIVPHAWSNAVTSGGLPETAERFTRPRNLRQRCDIIAPILLFWRRLAFSFRRVP